MPNAGESAGDSARDATTPPVRAGDVIAGKYRILGPLGAGGMGQVFSATHVSLGQKLAMKLVVPDDARGATERFAREAQIAAEMTCEQVPRVTDFGTLPDGTSYMVMEMLEGQDLDDVLEARGRLPIAEAVDYILQACVAVAEAHSRGIVHRDLKPGNIFVTKRPDGSPLVKVLDFGISKRTVAGGDTSLTQTGTALGSPLYMSPEQLRDAKRVDERTDVWSLAVVLYELVTGKSPFDGETLHETIAKIAADPHIPLRAVLPDVDPELDLLLERCLEKKPESRLPNVAELARALARFASPDSATTYLPRVCGSIEKIPLGAPSSQPRVEAAPSSRPSKAGSRTQRSWNTTMSPAGGRRRRIAALSIGAVVLAVGGVVAVAMLAKSRAAEAPGGAATTAPAPAASTSSEPAVTPITVVPATPSATAATAPSAAASAAVVASAAAPRPRPAPAPPPPSPKASARPKMPNVNDDPFRTR